MTWLTWPGRRLSFDRGSRRPRLEPVSRVFLRRRSRFISMSWTVSTPCRLTVWAQRVGQRHLEAELSQRRNECEELVAATLGVRGRIIGELGEAHDVVLRVSRTRAAQRFELRSGQVGRAAGWGHAADGWRLSRHSSLGLRRSSTSRQGRYRRLNGGRHLGDYLARPRARGGRGSAHRADPRRRHRARTRIPARFLLPPARAQRPQTRLHTIDLVAHRFVLDAKSSTQELAQHERQIRAYVDQRHLDYGVLFNLRELRIYRRGAAGHDPRLSFDVGRLRQVAHGE